jgi:hypothetical protein
MKSAEISNTLLNSYLALLENLSTNSKLELISRLSSAMKTNGQEQKKKLLKQLYGSYKGDESADELIAELKEARIFYRKREDL